MAIAVMLASASSMAFADVASAQASSGEAASGSPQGIHQTDRPPPSLATQQLRPDDIVVTARRGEALVDPETELSEDEIARYGANTIQELLDDVGPLIDGTDKAPVVLVNGKRIGGASGITKFPPEALARLAILPPIAAARYGYPSDQRVVNLVLKQKYSSFDGAVGATPATAGGRDSESGSFGRVAIDGSTFWNAQLELSRDSMLLKSARQFSSRADPIDLREHVSGLDGQVIDPSLAATIVDVPSTALIHPPGLSDFAAAAARPIRFNNPDDFYALLPGSRSVNFNVGITHPIGSFSASLNVNLGSSSSSQILGYPIVSLTLPAGNPWSPFAGNVLLSPRLAGLDPLKSAQSTKMLSVSGTVDGSIGGWNTNAIVNYTRSWSNSRFDRQLDLQDIQDRLDALDPSFNPYVPLPRAALIGSDHVRSQTETIDARLTVDRSLATLPAGPLTATFMTGINHMLVTSSDDASSVGQSSLIRQDQTQADLQISFNLPLTRRGGGMFAALGDLSASFAPGISTITGSGAQRKWDASLNWSPASRLQFYASYSSAEDVPNVAQLKGPRIETAGRIYDPLRQEVAQPTLISGGNPDLRRGTKTNLSIRGVWRPLGDRLLTLNLGYQRRMAKGGATSFPQLTPAVEQAFPDRVIRDASGHLIELDERSINTSRDTTAEFTNGFTLAWPSPGKPKPGASLKKSGKSWQITLSVNHSWQLESRLVIRPGIPVLDRLNGDGGQSHHALSFQLMANKKGLGATLDGQWRQAVRIRNAGVADGQGDFRYSAVTQFNLSLFAEPGNLSPDIAKKAWFSNTRVSIDLQNIFDSYQHVTLADGRVPEGYDRYELNPLGRTVQVRLHKRF